MANTPSAQGVVDPSFEPVRDAFDDVLSEHEQQDGTGAAVAVWHDGSWVVDLWGGWADVRRSRRWERDSIVMPYSVTKPFAAVCGLLLADRGLVDLDAALSTYWPEMSATTTVRQVLSHQSGLVLLEDDLPTEAFYDWDLICRRLAEQRPAWEPGTDLGESALFYGHLVGELVRRVDGRTLGTFLREEVCGPLALDFQVGLREDELDRVVDLTGYGDPFRKQGEGAPELRARALGNPPGAVNPAVVNSRAWRTSEIPAVNGHGTARAVAGLYAALRQGRVLSSRMLREATSVATSGVDRVVGAEVQWGLGFGVAPDGYGMGGLGGSFGWWSENGQYAFGFVTGLVADHERGDRVENAVRDVLGLPPV
jgi:CubicO group peptidase (beta-lactamase class C family)